MTKALLVKTTGEVEQISLPDQFAYLAIQDHVSGLFDCVYNRDAGICAYVNDEGLLINLDPNPAISLIFGQLIVGDAVIVGIFDENGESDGSDRDIPARFLSDDFRVRAMLAGTDEELRAKLVEMRDTIDWTPQVIF